MKTVQQLEKEKAEALARYDHEIKQARVRESCHVEDVQLVDDQPVRVLINGEWYAKVGEMELDATGEVEPETPPRRRGIRVPRRAGTPRPYAPRGPRGPATTEAPAIPGDEGWKRCTGCERLKKRKRFHVDRSTDDGYTTRCIACSSKGNRTAPSRRVLTVPVQARKTCLQCRKEKSVRSFNRNPKAHDGRSDWCKVCIGSTVRRIRTLNEGGQQQLPLD